MRRVAVAVSALLGAGLITFAPVQQQTADAAPNDIVAVVVEGTGFGHGRGMSQWGAYGWAVDQNKSWQWILDHYYGGTVLGDVATSQARIRVRLLGFDNATTVGVVAGSGTVTAAGVSRAAIYTKEISANRFEVYGSTTPACPSASSLVVPNGPIAKGSSNSTAVRQIQTFLNAFRVSGDSTLAVDGDFGNLTQARVSDWQGDQGLAVTGVWNTTDATRARQQIASGSSATWTLLKTVTGPVVFTSANGENSSAAPSSVLGLCKSAGSVTHYRGKLEVRSESVGNRVVNDVKTEDYLRGVVPKEISASWADAGSGRGANAVRAQAVAARSYGLQQNRYPPYATICDSQSCQVYFGSATRATPTAAPANIEDARTDAAIVATAGKVRKVGNAVASTEFSASNGPRTAGGVFTAVDDIPGDGTSRNPNHRWTRILDADTLAARYGLGSITSATMTEAASSTYRQFDGIWFNDIVLTGSNGKTFRQQAWDFRGANALPSPGFTVRVVTRDTTANSMAMIGDSVGNSIAGSTTSELRVLTDGTFAASRFDVVDSRCTTTISCPGTSGVQAAASVPIGTDLVVVQLGYNDWPPSFAGQIDQMMAALGARGVRQVAWVNLAEIRQSGSSSFYAASNAALAAAANRWPTLSILDWNAASNTAERPRWFSDDVHLTTTGQAKFALWLREQLSQLAPPTAGGPATRLAPPKKIELSVASESLVNSDGSEVTIPADVSAVALNVTTVGPSANGYVTVWPCSRPRPRTSSLNYASGAVDGNGVIAPVDSSGKACLYSVASTDVVVDVTGWFGPVDGEGAGFTAITPHRLADSRFGTGMPAGRLGAGTQAEIQVTGLAVTDVLGRSSAVPANAVAVAVNFTSVGAAAPGFVTAWPCGAARPQTSSLNYRAGEIRGNGAIVSIGAGGKICVFSSAQTDVVADVVGWFTPGASSTPFVSPVPQRIVDTRSGLGAPQRALSPDRPIEVGVAGLRTTVAGQAVTIPSSARAASINIAVDSPRAAGYVTVWPCGTTRPRTSNLNFAAGQIVSNNAIATLGTGGAICVHASTSANVIIDVTGWFNGGPTYSGVVPDRFVDTRYGIGPIPV